MTAYYNENDPKAAAWLRELIKADLIAPGEVDERSITEISPHDLTGYTQQHFFAGIGGWSYALRLAGWPDDRAVRTGSCPCQPFSAAGKQLGAEDERHLWPVFRDLITFGEPTVTFGEQVASSLGRDWLAGIRADLEGLGYAVGAADLCAAGAGSPHIRQRLYWVAYAEGKGRRARAVLHQNEQARNARARYGGALGGMGDANDARPQGRNERGNGADQWTPWAASVVLPCTDGKSRRIEPSSFPLAHGVSGRVGLLRGYGNAIVPQVAAKFIQACCESIA